MSFPENLSKRWNLEGQLFACIGTLDLLSRTFEKGELDPNIFHKQHKNLLTNIVATRSALEEYQFNIDDFIVRENLEQLYPNGLQKLRITEGTDENRKNQIDYSLIKRLPAFAAEFVANAIELLDLLKLEAIATVDRILPYLDEIYAILTQISVYGSDHWVSQDINQWIDWMDRKKPGMLLKDNDLKKLELQVARWLSDFRRELNNL